MSTGHVEVMVTGLPGTGKTLVGHVLSRCGISPSTTEQGQYVAYMCKAICRQIDPQAYPYYLPYFPTQEQQSIDVPDPDDDGMQLPTMMTVPYVAAAMPLALHCMPDAVIFCWRTYDQWLPVVKKAEPRRRIDFRSVYLSSYLLCLSLWTHFPTASFNVDQKIFKRMQTPEHSCHDTWALRGGDITIERLNTVLRELLDKDPHLGM